MTATFTPEHLCAHLDVDNDDRFDAATDGLLIPSLSAGLSRRGAVADAVAQPGRALSAAAIEGYLRRCTARSRYRGDNLRLATTDGC